MTLQWESIDRVSLGVVALIILLTFIVFFPLLKVVVLALSLAIVLIPYHEKLISSISPAISAFVLTLLVVMLGLLGVTLTIHTLYNNLDYLLYLINTIIKGFTGTAGSFLHQLPDLGFEKMIENLFISTEDALYSYIVMIPGIAFDLLIFFVCLSLFIYLGPDVGVQINRIIPDRSRENLMMIWRRAFDTLYSIYIVHVIIAILTLLLAIPFFWLLGFEEWVFLSILCGIFAFIPFLGPSALLVFLGLYCLVIGDYRTLILLLFVGYPLLGIFTDMYLRPVLMGKRVQINAVIIFIGFFGGLIVMGIVGFILGPFLLSLIVGGFHMLVRELDMVAESPGDTPAPKG
ncbi:AI-2E family transporter [Methanocalculus sp. MSAO_Arc2]|uniref:AI-2E family transporter n=1 Tax=Methanocalculus sp. MSAO_Arc2 TaxID=2293855 RepID=UPI00267FF1FE